MITKLSIENFKRFRSETFELDDVIVLAGPNNTGKSTLLQALSTWSLGLERWRVGKGRTGKAKQRSGTPLTRKDFTALPLREFDLLWSERSTALTRDELEKDQKPGEPRLIHIAVTGSAALRRINEGQKDGVRSKLETPECDVVRVRDSADRAWTTPLPPQEAVAMRPES